MPYKAARIPLWWFWNIWLIRRQGPLCEGLVKLFDKAKKITLWGYNNVLSDNLIIVSLWGSNNVLPNKVARIPLLWFSNVLLDKSTRMPLGGSNNILSGVATMIHLWWSNNVFRHGSNDHLVYCAWFLLLLRLIELARILILMRWFLHISPICG